MGNDEREYCDNDDLHSLPFTIKLDGHITDINYNIEYMDSE